MFLDTTIEGNPESIRAAATWLTTSLHPSAESAADTLAKIANDAGYSWNGAAGEAFIACIKNGLTAADQFSNDIDKAGRTLLSSADELARLQLFVSGIRADAAAAGLVVIGAIIYRPIRPADVPATIIRTTAEKAAYDQAIAAISEYNRLATAYSEAQQDFAQAEQSLNLLQDTVNNVFLTLEEKWFFVAADVAVGLARGLPADLSSHLPSKIASLSNNLRALEHTLRSPPAGTSAAELRGYRSAAALHRQEIARLSTTASRMGTVSKYAARLGPALAVASVAYDIHNGKPVEQAVVAGGVGFAASVAAGAAIGTLIPIPFVGTGFGVVGGVIVGLVASGYVDALYENKLFSLSKAASAGADAFASANRALGDGADALASAGRAAADRAGDALSAGKEAFNDGADAISSASRAAADRAGDALSAGKEALNDGADAISSVGKAAADQVDNLTEASSDFLEAGRDRWRAIF